MRMVIMEYVEGDTVDNVSALPKEAREKIRRSRKFMMPNLSLEICVDPCHAFRGQSIPDRFRPSWKGERGAIPPKSFEEYEVSERVGDDVYLRGSLPIRIRPTVSQVTVVSECRRT